MFQIRKFGGKGGVFAIILHVSLIFKMFSISLVIKNY